MITIDFETRSKIDIKTGSCRYASDPSTSVMCLVYKIGDSTQWWSPFFPDVFPKECPDDLAEAIENREKIEAHNASFEANIWYYQMYKKYRWPRIEDDQWYCSAAKAARLALPRALGELNKTLMTPIQKSKEGHLLMLKMSKPRKPTKHDKSVWHEKPEDFLKLFEYCDTDVLAEESASLSMPELDERERRVWLLDQTINMRGFRCDTELAKKMMAICDRFKEDRTKDLIELTDGEIETPGQRDKIIAFLNRHGCEMPNLQAETVDEFLEDPLVSGVPYDLLKIKKDLSKTSVNRIQKYIDSTMYAGRICDTLLYCGASTGRWAGRGIQPHNPPRSTIKDVDDCIEDIMTLSYEAFIKKRPNVLESLSSCIRGLMCAADGNEFVVADFAAIESRVLFWLALEEGGLEIYRNRGLIYEDMAEVIYKKPINKKDNPDERFVAKEAVLGCGYGMGAKRFKAHCAEKGKEVSTKLAELAVNSYREKFSQVPKFWYAVENAAIKAVRRKGEVIKCGRVKWCSKDKYLMCLLPSGRKLYYYLPRIGAIKTPWGETKPGLTFMASNAKTKKFERTKVWGGLLVENITQGVARDFLVNSMFNVDDAGYRIVMHVHDEIVCEVPKGWVKLGDFEALMAVKPTWAEDCPIEVEGWIGPRFKKG